jgi:hypothetical protein
MMLDGEKKTFEPLVEANRRKSRKANLALGDDDVSAVGCDINSVDFLVNGQGMGTSEHNVQELNGSTLNDAEACCGDSRHRLSVEHSSTSRSHNRVVPLLTHTFAGERQRLSMA